MAAIRNIIFDLGGVLLNLDYARTTNAFQQLGVTHFDNLFTQARQSGFFDAFDRGELSAEEFRTHLQPHLPPHTTAQQIDQAWNAMLLDFPTHRFELLKTMQSRYRTFLLSNTNTIHVDAFTTYLQNSFGITDFSDYFERWYYSCTIGKRKPDAQAFQHVLEENNLRIEETLFIDDTRQHIDGAAALGIQTLWLEPGKDIADLLREKNL